MKNLVLGYKALDPQVMYWETQKGTEFLKRIGINKGDNVLDFGCRVGHYAIPAAEVIGNEGVVYAIDTEEKALLELEQKIKALNFTNIRIIKTFGQLTLPLEEESIDVVLLYDVLHYLKEDERKKLYQETFRVLKEKGMLSVYPKHCLTDDPIMEFQNMDLNTIKHEIENLNFNFTVKHCDHISHDDGLNQGCVFNFRKKM
ncbi:MAG: class I SAM-dependent methyltransferase [Sedimentisphaerales bacterium]|nr:class I SAM-dependent methyltransferase [Sedimentisphaerales bacterium]